MLKITIPSIELYNEVTSEFSYSKECELLLEHSLVSISKWESKWHKPFLSKESKTPEETLDYIRAMTVTQNVDPEVYKYINQAIIDRITEYIDDPMTATTFRKETEVKRSNEVITSELIYYWMTSFNIQWESQRWHLNRLLTLINVFNIKNQTPKKMKAKEVFARNKALNEARKAQLNTKG